jgi:hypothetical protein
MLRYAHYFWGNAARVIDRPLMLNVYWNQMRNKERESLVCKRVWCLFFSTILGLFGVFSLSLHTAATGWVLEVERYNYVTVLESVSFCKIVMFLKDTWS